MSSRKGVRNCNLTSNRSCQVNVMEYKVMWSVSSLRHVAGTVAGCCPLVSAVLSDSLRAAAGSCSAPPGVSTGTNPPPRRPPRAACDPWTHHVPPVGQTVNLSRKCPPFLLLILLLMRSHRDHSERIYLLFLLNSCDQSSPENRSSCSASTWLLPTQVTAKSR